MKITWRKKEWGEFVRLQKSALMRRRVNEMPAYLQPVGFGFSIVRPIRQGFWRDPETNLIYVGFLDGGGSNFHYFTGGAGMPRSSASHPLPALVPVSFAEGYHALKVQIVQMTKEQGA